MEAIAVLMTFRCRNTSNKNSTSVSTSSVWNFPQKKGFLKENSGSIRAVVGSAHTGADRELLDSLPGLEIVSSFSVGLDKVDLRERLKELRAFLSTKLYSEASFSFRLRGSNAI